MVIMIEMMMRIKIDVGASKIRAAVEMDALVQVLPPDPFQRKGFDVLWLLCMSNFRSDRTG